MHIDNYGANWEADTTDWINYYGVLKGRFSIPGVGVRSVMSVGPSGWYSVKGRSAVASVASETKTPGNCDPHVGEESQSHVSTCSCRVCFLPATRVKMCRDANFTWSHCSCCKWFFKIIIHIKSLFIPTITSNLYISSPCSFIKKHFPLSLPFLSNHNVELHEKGGPVRSWACRKQDPHVGCYDKQSGNYSSRGDVERREGIATVSATRTGS